MAVSPLHAAVLGALNKPLGDLNNPNELAMLYAQARVACDPQFTAGQRASAASTVIERVGLILDPGLYAFLILGLASAHRPLLEMVEVVSSGLDMLNHEDEQRRLHEMHVTAEEELR